jgi:hypothetical protein
VRIVNRLIDTHNLSQFSLVPACQKLSSLSIRQLFPPRLSMLTVSPILKMPPCIHPRYSMASLPGHPWHLVWQIHLKGSLLPALVGKLDGLLCSTQPKVCLHYRSTSLPKIYCVIYLVGDRDLLVASRDNTKRV